MTIHVTRLLIALVLVTNARRVCLADDPAEAKRLAYEQAALTIPGDAAKGRTLFLDNQKAKCIVCHRCQDVGGEAGPDLTRIGGKFDRPHLIESLLEPSRQIVEGYRTTIVVTVDGKILTGIKKAQSDAALDLIDALGNRHSIAARMIEEVRTSDVSVMPAGLADSLTSAEFIDLIAYLESLRGGSQSPGEAVGGGIKLPPGFSIQTVVTGLTGGTALETTTDGRVFVCEQTGALRVIRNGRLLSQPFVTLPVDSTWERGLVGVTVDPKFPEVPYVYVCYVAKDPYPHHRVSRFVADGDVAQLDSEEILLAGDDQRTLGGKVPAGHQGGAIHFGTDGKLYIAIGEQTAETPSQSLNTLQGKLLRIDADGLIPADNPFFDKTTGKYQAIWALGLRNPFTFAIDRQTGQMFINDVGGSHEEINRGVAGANYGWPAIDHGPTKDPRFVGPIHFYPQASVAGGDFMPRDLPWPDEYRHHYFFGDFVHGWIKTLDPDHPERVTLFGSGFRRPVDLRFAPDGSLYVLLRNAWVIDDKFQGQTSSLLRIQRATP